MNVFKRLFASQEVRAALGVLDELECRFHCPAFRIVRNELETKISSDTGAVTAFFRQKKMPIREWVLAAVANSAGDHAASGDYHVYRGLLMPETMGGPGQDFVRIHDSLVDELTRLGVNSAEKAERIKAGLRDQIREAG